MILYFLWIDISKHGLFCHNCNTLTSLYLCVWSACKPASPGVSRATGLKLITHCQCGKLWGYFHWLVMTWLWPAIWVLLSLSSNCQHERKQKDDSCEVGNTSISVCNFQSNCVRARNTRIFKLQFGMCPDELLADQLPTQFQWAVRLSGSAQ